MQNDIYDTTKGYFIVIITITIVLIALFSLDLIELRIPPNNDSEFHSDLHLIPEKQLLIQTLKQALPAYTSDLLADTTLNTEQLDSLKLGYVPLINEFFDTGKIETLDKAETIKQLVLENKLTLIKNE